MSILFTFCEREKAFALESMILRDSKIVQNSRYDIQPLDLLVHTSPALFATVQGVVRIMGTASGADLAYYRLQVGQGLNPQEWTQVGEDQAAPVEDGLLGEWDTQGLSGLYAVQLVGSTSG